jgi:hypothetical protein
VIILSVIMLISFILGVIVLGVIMLSVLTQVDPAFVMLPCSQSDVIVTVNLLNHFNGPVLF